MQEIIQRLVQVLVHVGGNMIVEVTCSNLGFILRMVNYLFKIMQWVIPILLIVLVTIDFLKVMAGSADEKAKNEAMARVGKRIVYAVIIFLVPILVKLIFRVIGNARIGGYSGASSPNSWVSCFNQYFN